jgi:predicted DCC family thiol-disulfide oxidoreductase YuxK
MRGGAREDLVQRDSTSAPDPEPQSLTVLYDERCRLCRRCRDWLLTQPCFLRVELLAAGSPGARARYGAVPWLGSELVAVDDRGRVWVGPAAFLTCLWATVRFRAWSYRLAGPSLAPLASHFFRLISKRRLRWSSWPDGVDDEKCTWCDRSSIRGLPPLLMP